MGAVNAGRSALFRLSVVACAAAVGLGVMSAPAHAEVSAVPDAGVAKLAGSGYALLQVGDRTFVGGTFTKLGGKPRQNLGAVLADGSIDPGFLASTDGKVDDFAVSEDGTRLFIGGKFTTVNGEPRANLAAIDPVTGELVDDWSADTTGSTPDVRSLAVRGDRLYVAGRFQGIDGTTRRKRLAVVSVSTGQLDLSFNARPNGGVREIRLSPDGSLLYAAGAFTSLDNQARSQVASVDPETGAAGAFAPAAQGGNAITFELSPDGQRLWYGTDNNTVYAFDPFVSSQPIYSFKMSGNTQAMAASSTTLYFGGHFSQSTTEKKKRYFFAAVDVATGKLTSWDPDATGGKMGVWDLMIEGDKLHATGVFSKFAAQTISQRGYARFSGTP